MELDPTVGFSWLRCNPQVELYSTKLEEEPDRDEVRIAEASSFLNQIGAPFHS